jgi:hypothetical protein
MLLFRFGHLVRFSAENRTSFQIHNQGTPAPVLGMRPYKKSPENLRAFQFSLVCRFKESGCQTSLREACRPDARGTSGYP